SRGEAGTEAQRQGHIEQGHFFALFAFLRYEIVSICTDFPSYNLRGGLTVPEIQGTVASTCVDIHTSQDREQLAAYRDRSYGLVSAVEPLAVETNPTGVRGRSD